MNAAEIIAVFTALLKRDREAFHPDAETRVRIFRGCINGAGPPPQEKENADPDR